MSRVFAVVSLVIYVASSVSALVRPAKDSKHQTEYLRDGYIFKIVVDVPVDKNGIVCNRTFCLLVFACCCFPIITVWLVSSGAISTSLVFLSNRGNQI